MTPALPELVALSADRCEEIVESVSQRVGLYPSAWDMVDPHDLVRAFAAALATQPAHDSGLGEDALALLKDCMEFTEYAAAALVGSHPLSDEYKDGFLELGEPLQQKLRAALAIPSEGEGA